MRCPTILLHHQHRVESFKAQGFWTMTAWLLSAELANWIGWVSSYSLRRRLRQTMEFKRWKKQSISWGKWSTLNNVYWNLSVEAVAGAWWEGVNKSHSGNGGIGSRTFFYGHVCQNDSYCSRVRAIEICERARWAWNYLVASCIALRKHWSNQNHSRFLSRIRSFTGRESGG